MNRTVLCRLTLRYLNCRNSEAPVREKHSVSKAIALKHNFRLNLWFFLHIILLLIRTYFAKFLMVHFATALIPVLTCTSSCSSFVDCLQLQQAPLWVKCKLWPPVQRNGSLWVEKWDVAGCHPVAHQLPTSCPPVAHRHCWTSRKLKTCFFLMRRTRTDEDEAESNVMKAGDRWELQEEATVQQRSGRLLSSGWFTINSFRVMSNRILLRKIFWGLLHLNTTYIQIICLLLNTDTI